MARRTKKVSPSFLETQTHTVFMSKYFLLRFQLYQPVRLASLASMASDMELPSERWPRSSRRLRTPGIHASSVARMPSRRPPSASGSAEAARRPWLVERGLLRKIPTCASYLYLYIHCYSWCICLSPPRLLSISLYLQDHRRCYRPFDFGSSPQGDRGCHRRELIVI